MKYFFTPLIIFSFQFAFGQQNADSVLASNNVTEVRIYHNQRLAGIRKYNEDQQLVTHMYDNFIGGPIRTWSTRTFNDKRLEIESKSTHSSYPNDTTHKTMDYNSNGDIIWKKNVSTGQLIYDYQYDDDNRLIQDRFFKDGELTMTKKLKYNDSGQLIESTIINHGMSIDPRTTYYSYDDVGNEIETKIMLNDQVYFKTTYEYDEGNKMIRKTYSRNDKEYGVKFKHDNKGRLTHRIHFDIIDNQEIDGRTEKLAYFKNGLIKYYYEEIFTINSEPRKFKYEYK